MCENNQIIITGFVVGILSLWSVGGSHMDEMNNSHLWHRPSRGRGSLARQDHQARCPHFHSQGQGSTPNLSHKKQKPGCWDMDYRLMEYANFMDSMINLTSRLRCYRTPETLWQLLILCVIQIVGLPDVTFPLCSNLCRVKHWRTEENEAHYHKHLSILFIHVYVNTQLIHTFQFGFVFTVTNFCIVAQEFIIILLLFLLRMVHGHHSGLR